MKVVVNTISTKKHSGGAYQIAYNFLMETLHNQEDVEWYYITSSDVDELVGNEFERLKGSKYFVFPTQPDFKGSYQRVKKELIEWEKKYKPDVIYTISSPCYFSFKTPEIMRFANAWVTNPNKFAWQSMPLLKRLRMHLYRINQKRILRKAEYIITQSEAVRKGLLKITGLENNRIAVIPNVLPQVFNNATVKRAEEDGWINIVCAAAPVPHKNLDIIPRVLFSLKENHGISNVRFHLTIPEDDALFNRIKIECQKNGMADRIVNHGRCTQKQLIDIYNQCSICFLPTLLETFSASSLEAMYFGMYIVATDFDFNSEVIANAGLYYKPTDAKDAASKIALLIDDNKLQADLDLKMRERIQLYNDYSLHFKKTVAFLESVYKQ